MRPKLILLLLALIFIIVPRAQCEDLSQMRLLFYQANDDYSSAKFSDAISAYEKILELGYESGPLYYNLGNAYFKEGTLGKAILNYTRAQRLMPQDADLRPNLDYARSKIKGGMVFVKRNYFTRAFFDLADSFSLDAVTVYSTILYIAVSIMLVINILAKRLRRPLIYIIMPMSALLVICLSIFYVQFSGVMIQKEAVVIARSIDSVFEPFEGATVFFTLSEGESVVVVATKDDWVKIRRADNKMGWIKKAAIEYV